MDQQNTADRHVPNTGADIPKAKLRAMRLIRPHVVNCPVARLLAMGMSPC
ncbi:MAG: hypothetical protein U0521_22125 [Anaerolineae bacterium]